MGEFKPLLPIGGTTVRVGSVALTDASGGTSLGSGVVTYGIKIKCVSGASAWIGGNTPGNAPFSGMGFLLSNVSGSVATTTLDLPVTNVNQLRGVGSASGIIINWIGIDS